MEMRPGSHRSTAQPPACAGRVHQRGREPVGPPRFGEGGFTLIEVVVTMVLLSVGLMGLGPMMISVMQGNRFAQDMTLATSLAEDRIEEILHQPVFSSIMDSGFPDEPQGQIRNGDAKYRKFSRTVSVVDSTDVLGRILMKNVTVVVSWTGLSGRTHDVTLHGKVSRF